MRTGDTGRELLGRSSSYPWLCAIAFSCTCISMHASVVRASPKGDALHKQALAAAEEGAYRKAKALWEEAYRLDQEPKYLFNLGMVAEESDRAVEALDYFERFLREAPLDRPPYAGLAPKARARVKALLQRVAVLEVIAGQPGVEVFVDQRSLGKGPLRSTVRLPQGKHLVVATLAGHHGQTRTFTLFGGQRVSLRIELRKIRPRILREKAEMRYPMPRWLPWTLLGLGAAVALTAVAPLVVSKDRYDIYNARPEDHPELGQSAERLKYGGIGMIVAGSAIAATGLVMVILNRPRLVHQPARERAGAVETMIGPGSVAIRLRF